MVARRRGLTLVEVALGIALLGVVVVFVLLELGRKAHEARNIRCRNHLNCLAKGMATYLGELGDGRWFPCPLGRGAKPNDFTGAEWIATQYWVRVHPDPDCYLCPESGDTNHKGRDLGVHGSTEGHFGPQTVSYAGLHFYSLTDEAGNPIPGALRDDFPPDEPFASDDTEGAVNHGTGSRSRINVMFADSHVESRAGSEIDVERAVGQKGGLLWRLRN